MGALWAPQLTFPYMLSICVQLASGLQHLHACGVLHRDLKSDNALVQSVTPLIVKWADFGCSVKLAAAANASAPDKGAVFPSTCSRIFQGRQAWYR